VDEFWTEIEARVRGRAADYFRGRPAADPAPALSTADAIWRDLAGRPDRGEPSGAADGLSLRVLIVGEAARHEPLLGHDLRTRPFAALPDGRVEEIACRLAEAAGAADHVLEAGARAARERGFYSSSLMGFREVQERLAGLASGAELARLGACRLCRLLARGEASRAGLEASGLEARASALAAEVRSVAGSLLGPSWAAARLPAAEGPSPDERTSE